MLKIIHVLTGVAALILSFIPSFSGEMPSPLQHPDALCLLLLGLLNVQFAANARLSTDGPTRPVLLGASALLIVAVVAQAAVLLAPIVSFAGQPATLASLALASIAVLLQLATTQSQPTAARQRTTTTAPRKPQQAHTAVSSAEREKGTVKWFNTSKGFGFISRDSGDDVFVHFRAIRGEGHRVLVEGQRVEFTIMMRDKGLQAEDVIAAQPGQ